MSYNFKAEMNKPERLAPGHRMCAGCGGTITVRAVLRALHEGDKAVIGNATGCLEVSTFMDPYTAYEDSYIHNAFENAGATMSGVETAYNILKRKVKSTIRTNSSPLAVTAEPTTSDSSHSQVPWSETTIWYMYATITERT